ncbi:hypothetical protein ONS96_001153 [Cadophora gregata f. sp. sojae]|nr:hypothetical protein ONS96_001153 [Cadophora gregata f. sp. sojae]
MNMTYVIYSTLLLRDMNDFKLWKYTAHCPSAMYDVSSHKSKPSLEIWRNKPCTSNSSQSSSSSKKPFNISHAARLPLLLLHTAHHPLPVARQHYNRLHYNISYPYPTSY